MTTSMKPYLIDNDPADFQEVIKKARELGMLSEKGLWRSSVAAEYLRERGYKVEENPEYKG